MKGPPVAAALDHGSHRHGVHLTQLFQTEFSFLLYKTAQTQFPIRLSNSFGNRRTKMASDEEAMVGREEGRELPHRRFRVERSGDTDGQGAGFFRCGILLSRAGRMRQTIDDKARAETVEEGFQPEASRDLHGGVTLLHGRNSPRGGCGGSA